jgi:hypothetical protein
LSVDADIPTSEDLFGKTVSDLQSNVHVGDGTITGTLKYVDDYTGFSSKTDEQSGNYLVIHAADPKADYVTVEVINGIAGPRTLDSDGLIVLRIADKNTQSIEVVSYKDGIAKDNRRFVLTGLTLEPAPANG